LYNLFLKNLSANLLILAFNKIPPIKN